MLRFPLSFPKILVKLRSLAGRAWTISFLAAFLTFQCHKDSISEASHSSGIHPLVTCWLTPACYAKRAWKDDATAYGARQALVWVPLRQLNRQ